MEDVSITYFYRIGGAVVSYVTTMLDAPGSIACVKFGWVLYKISIYL